MRTDRSDTVRLHKSASMRTNDPTTPRAVLTGGLITGQRQLTTRSIEDEAACWTSPAFSPLVVAELARLALQTEIP